MKISEKLLIALLVLGVSFHSWGLSGARLLGQSASGHTVLFNLGLHDGTKEGDYAIIVKELRDPSTRDLRLIPVAKGRNIKMDSNQSIWILYKLFDSDLMVKGDKFLILSESSLLSGRRDPRLGRIKVVSDQDKIVLRAKEVLSEDRERLSRLKVKYPEIETLHEREQRSDQDGELIDLEVWKKIKGEKHRAALYKSPHQRDFAKRLRLETFEKLVTAYLKKVNDPDFNYDRFYDEQMKTEFQQEFRKRSSFPTEYETFLSNQAQKAVADAKLYRSILEKGKSWSEDFSDEELSAILNSVSVLQEKDRREFVVAKPNRYSAYFTYGVGLNENQTEKDTRYRRDHLYSVEMEFEAVPLLKHETLERFTFSGSIRLNKTAFEAEEQNVNFDETSLTLGANWYPLYASYEREAPVLFFGLYLRTGWGQATAPIAGEKANYTLIGAPGFRGGMKYNFRNNVGLRLSASIETLQLEQYETSKVASVLPEQTNIPEAKLNFALVYSF